jgi:hypothetical protein
MFGSLPFDHFVAPRWGERSQVYNVVLRIIHYEIPCGSYTRKGSLRPNIIPNTKPS